MAHRHPYTHCTRRLIALLACLLSTACGGGSAAPTAGAPSPTDGGDTTALVLTLAPTTVQANFNTPVTLTGRGFVAPASVEFLDAAGGPLAGARAALVRDNGTRLETTSPLLADMQGTTTCRVRVHNGDGSALDVDQPITLENPVADVRSIDGSGNNTADAAIGSAGSMLRADVPHAYADGVSAPAGAGRPSARAISNAVCAQTEAIENAPGVSDIFWLWGQFIDHDVDLTPEAEPAEPFAIEVPTGDVWFDPDATGGVTLGLNRSTWRAGTGTSVDNPRRQTNEITSWIDAGNVYGSDAVRARALRTLDGTGKLKTSEGNLLPFNTDGLPNAPSAFIPTFFLAGDVRANEQLGLTALHTLFMREHNRVVEQLRIDNPDLSGDELYEAGRRGVGAELQVITTREFLPLLLGRQALGPYRGYDATVDGSIGILFSTACYRFGHSMVSGEVLRLDAQGETIAEGNLALRDAFFNPGLLITEGGLEPILRGFAAKRAQELDPLIVDDLRNFLFGAPGAGGLDLAALNIQRGRDHGLPDYNTVRESFGLPRNERIADVSANADYVARLASIYADVDDMDVWLCALCEDKVPGAMVGRLLHRVFTDQFRRLRDGDRFWYQNLYRGEALRTLERTRLSDVIRRNTAIGSELGDDVFIVPDRAGAEPRTPRPRNDRSAADMAALVGQTRFFR